MYPLIVAPSVPVGWPDTGHRTLPAAVRSRLPRRWPRVGTTLAVTFGTVVSLAPGLLPRGALTQAVLTALLVVAALGVTGLHRWAHRHRTGHTAPGRPALSGRPRRTTTGDHTTGVPERNLVWAGLFPYRWPVLPERARRATAVALGSGPVFAAGAVAILAAMLHAEVWQNTLRDGMGVARTGPQYWPVWAVLTVLLVAAPVPVVAGAGRVLRRIGWSRGLAMAVVAVLPLALTGGPMVAQWGGQLYSPADPDSVRPAAVTRSGSVESLVRWSSLGREGQRFVTAGASESVRVYVGLRSAPDPAARAELAVRELDRAGGFDRSHLVVAVPTGSGWVDARALRGFDARFGGDVAVAALQYSQLPSWATFMFGRGGAAESARALFVAVERHAATLPDPPRLYLYGQSLGALGGSAVFADATDQNDRACSVLWAGPPGGIASEPGARTELLANSSDPVVRWSPDLLWRAPDLSAVRHDAPAPSWWPGVSFVQTTVDLLGALGAPPGHGHRYGVDQGEALPGCGVRG